MDSWNPFFSDPSRQTGWGTRSTRSMTDTATETDVESAYRGQAGRPVARMDCEFYGLF